MSHTWSILYRGPLSSCNYDCSYCPFAKTRNTREELQDDEARLRRFADWVAKRPERIGVLFTPWGEAAIHKYYQQVLTALSWTPNVWRAAIQTNLSFSLDWLQDVNSERLALWCTFHPTQTTLEAFAARCQQLDALGIRYSVGVVGTRDALSSIESLRNALPQNVYVWVNALKRAADYYTTDEIEFLTRIDPYFPINNQRHRSLGSPCRTGDTVFSVDGNGDMRRCHFVPTRIGNIYEPGFEQALYPRPCPNETCGCHIGYAHLEKLQLNDIFGHNLLERIPLQVASA